MSFSINWDKKGVYVKFNGIVNSKDLIDANNYILSNSNFESIHYQVLDFFNIKDFQVTTYDISIIGTLNKSQIGLKNIVKVAILTKDEYIKDIVEEYKKLMIDSIWTIKEFSSAEKVLEWIE